LQTSTNTVIEASHLSFSYERQKVLEDVHFTLEEKEFLAIIGPNGGGKSTLLKLLLGIHPLQQGDIKLFGKAHTTQTQHIGYVPQNTNINVTFPISVLAVVMMGQNSMKHRLFGYKKEEKQQAYAALEKVNMQTFASKSISDLSGGQRQRVFIARALFSNPKILLLDEPTSSIDSQGSKQVYETLKALNKDITIVVVSHDISVVLQYATRAFYINRKLVNHDLNTMRWKVESDAHICEVELLEMLGECKC
jgi:zinc transport system ATP-binding protein